MLGALALWRLRTPCTPAVRVAQPDLRAEVAWGLRWLLGQRLVRDMALITGASNFSAAATPLLLIVLTKSLGADEAQIGWAFLLGAVGAILGAMVGGQTQRRFSFGQVIIGTLALQALLFPCFACRTGVLGLGLIYGLVMFAGPVCNVVQFSDRIALIPDALQGRVNSSFRLIAHMGHPAGAVLCGLLLEHSGSSVAVACFGLV